MPRQWPSRRTQWTSSSCDLCQLSWQANTETPSVAIMSRASIQYAITKCLDESFGHHRFLSSPANNPKRVTTSQFDLPVNPGTSLLSAKRIQYSVPRFHGCSSPSANADNRCFVVKLLPATHSGPT
jgi:hypothetical protein